MSFERPAKGLLVFQCNVCFDNFEFSKADGDDVGDFKSCWRKLQEDGWTMNGTDHLCADCTQIAKSERANPFRR